MTRIQRMRADGRERVNRNVQGVNIAHHFKARRKISTIGSDQPFVMIGEKINRPQQETRGALRGRHMDFVRQLAERPIGPGGAEVLESTWDCRA